MVNEWVTGAETVVELKVTYDRLDGCTVTVPAVFQRTENCRRHYEQQRRWPERLIVLGDAACAFNSIYRQGMSVAPQTALALQHTLPASKK